jgi:tetratricopeptide (TPR) repeat protein
MQSNYAIAARESRSLAARGGCARRRNFVRYPALAPKKHKRAARDQSPDAPAPRSRPAAKSAPAPRSLLESPGTALLIALSATLAVYARCFRSEFVFDDFDFIVNNPLIEQWSFIWRSFGHDLWWFRTIGPATKSSYYRPLEDAWLGFNYHLWGYYPPGWHVMIVAAHLAVVGLVYVLGWRLTRRRWAAAAGAILFGVMPVHVEAAAWPVAMPLPAVTAFVIGAMLMFIDRARAPLKYLGLSLVCYAGGLLTYELAITLPALIAAYVFLIEDAPGEGAARGIASRALDALWKIVPFIAVTLVYLGLRIAVLGFVTRHAVGNTASVLQGLLSLPAAIAAYLELIALPWKAGLGHEFQLVNSIRDPRFYLPVGGLLALAAAAAALLYRSPRRALYAFLLVWIVIGLAPVLNLSALVPFALIQDRYTYLSSVAFCILLADVASEFVARGGEARNLAYAVATTVLAINVLLLWNQLGVWHDEVSLFSQCIRQDPESGVCHGRLAMALETRGDLAGARRELDRAIAIEPDDPASLYNLADLDLRAGRFAQAAREYSKAAAALPDAPAVFYLHAAQAAAQAGEPQRAEAALKRAEANPELVPEAHFVHAQILANQGDYAGSLRILRGLTERAPDHFEYWAGMGSVLDASGDHGGAAKAYAQAVRLNPRNAELLLMYAQALHLAGQDDQALAAARGVLKVAPNSRAAQELMSELSKPSTSGNNLIRR